MQVVSKSRGSLQQQDCAEDLQHRVHRSSFVYRLPQGLSVDASGNKIRQDQQEEELM